MDLLTKLFYGGQYPCVGANAMICVELFVNKQITKAMASNNFSFLYKFPRLRYIPHWSLLTGIAEFSHANDTKQIQTNDISPHIYEHDTNQHQLQTTINKIGNHPLNRQLPWWDLHIIHCVNNDDNDNPERCETVLIFRCDHCIGDGITLIKFLVPHLFSKADGEPLDSNIKPRETAPLSPFSTVALIINALWYFLAMVIATADTFNETTSKMGPIFGTQLLLHRSVSSKCIKEIQSIINSDNYIRKKLNVMNDDYISMNDIILSIGAGAWRAVLLEETDNTQSIDDTVLKSLLITAKPFVMTKAETIQNRWLVASVPYYVNIENHITRTIETANAMKPIKNPYHLSTIFFLVETFGNWWIYAIKVLNYRFACTHNCYYSMLNFTEYKEKDTFISGTDIQVMDIGVFVGDLIKAHLVEAFRFGDRISLNITCGSKGEPYATKWFGKFELVSGELLESLQALSSVDTC